MADKRIDQLTAATSLVDSDLLVVEQSSTAKKATGTVVSNYINSKFGLSGMASDISTLQTAVAGKQDALILPLPVSQGGTGATTAANARVNLGLGTAAVADIDATLSVQDAVADAKAVGDGINNIESTILFDASSSLTWAVGAISSSNGTNSSSTTRIRTNNYIPKSASSISVESGYKYILFAYNGGSYVGTWNGTNFTKTGNWRTASLYLKALPDYDYKLVFANSNDTAMSVDYAENVHVMAYTDESLTISGKAADAKVTGDMLKTGYSLTISDSRTQTLASGTDLNNLTTPGNYRVLSASVAQTILNCPTSSAFRITVSWVYGSAVPMQELRLANGKTYYRTQVSGSWSEWRSYASLLLQSKDSTENRTAAILTNLNTDKICELTKGVFVIENLNMPVDSTIRGVGRGTVLQLPAGSTGYAIKMAKGCTIENVKIVGTGGEAWTPDGTANDSDGILINVEGAAEDTRNRMNISDIEVCGFSGAGIKLLSTGTNYDNTVNIVNAYIHNNNYGIDDPKNSEYNRISNCSIARNNVGIRMNGGNNLVSNCGINGNVTGIVMDATGISGANNNSHGTFSCCNINHSHAFESSTSTTAISIVGMNSGEVFSGCHIGFGGVNVSDSLGIHFADCNFLRETAINVSGTGFVLMSDCIFSAAADSPITGDGSIALTNCYYRSGTPRT